MMFKRRSLYIAIGLLLVLVVTAGCGGRQSAVQAAKPAPNFPEGPYVSVDDLKREMERGADFVILDARPKADYELDHIPGAISMPFFEVEQRYKELPRDKWIVAYCACPRAESQEAVRVLKEKGFQKVKVLYEGYFEWLARGYPVEKGTSG